jgi:GNAT superfamily N-acetyltransferase
MTRIIRTLALPEIATLLDWAAAEGWNPGLNDAMAFQAADPSGFFGAFVDGVMVAGISAVAYDAAFGFIGLYICHPDWRGQGHGKAVWDAGMAYLGERTIGLDGVPEQQANYAAMGFVPAYETIRMGGTLTSDQASGHQVPPVAGLEEIRDLDRECFPVRRDGFLKTWLVPPNRSMVHRGDGIVDGYAVLRPCRSGAKVGPLFAHDMGAALDLLADVSGPVQIDVPAIQTDWLEALAARGLEPGFRTKRMYRGALPPISLDRVFGVSSLELG